jgi:hypothetical protein
MNFDRANFEEFCGKIQIPSKEEGLIPFGKMWGTQKYFLDRIEYGLERGIHEFVGLKGRQQGITTLCDALDLWWPQKYDGIQGMLVADEDENKNFRRDVLRQMLESLPKSYRLQAGLDNQGIMRWSNGSRLLFSHAAQRTKKGKTKLGRGRGLNYLHADEVGAWTDDKAVGGLQASLAEQFPRRLFLWASTAQGFDVFKTMYDRAEHAVTKLAIFIGWWLHDNYRVTEEQRDLWEAYATHPPTSDERQWIAHVQRRFGIGITKGQLAWYRYQLQEKFEGDETLLAQEHPCLPEDAFQAFGDKFISPAVIQRLRRESEAAPPPKGYEYEWAQHITDVEVRQCAPHDATLTVWEEPAQDGAYIVAAHPWGSSGPNANEFVVEVFRAWPDRLAQVAEYAAPSGNMYHFAWICLHLAGAYHTFMPAYFILEIGMAGMHVLTEIHRLERVGYGLPAADRARIANLLSSVQHYLYRRPDSFSSRALKQMKSSAEIRARMLYGLRDEVERGHMDIRSAELIGQLSGLRRGEDGNQDKVAGGAAEESRAVCAAMAVEAWLGQAMLELSNIISPRDVDRDTPTEVVQNQVADFLWMVRQSGVTE